MIRRIIKDIRETLNKRKKKRNAKYTEPLNSEHNLFDAFVAYNHYGGYCVPADSINRVVVRRLLNGRVYEPDTIEFMRENCGNGDIVHAGSFFGDFLPGLSTALADDAMIWAFEPGYNNFRCAQMTIILNDLKNVHLKNFGLGETKTTEALRIQRPSGEHMGGGSEIVQDDDPWRGTMIHIDINRLDDSIPEDRDISIIQLDIEGYEEQALKGALSTIKRCKPLLILEDEKDSTEETWFRENIIPLGYSFTEEIHNNKVFAYAQ